MEKKTYQIIWEDEAAKQLKLLLKEKSEQVKELIENILSQDPYNELRYIERKVRPNKHLNIKKLDYDWAGYWRLKYKNYRIVYEINDEKILVEIFKMGDRSGGFYKKNK